MSWIGVAAIAIGLYLAFKVVGFALKLAMWALVLGGIYWVLASVMHWPPLTQLVG